jgi:hypothetical protein
MGENLVVNAFRACKTICIATKQPRLSAATQLPTRPTLSRLLPCTRLRADQLLGAILGGTKLDVMDISPPFARGSHSDHSQVL